MDYGRKPGATRNSKKKQTRKTTGQILRETIDKFGLSQAEICRKTRFLASQYPADYKDVAQDQLSRFINGACPDMMGSALRAVIASMPPEAQMYYRSLLEMNEIDAQISLSVDFERWLERNWQSA